MNNNSTQTVVFNQNDLMQNVKDRIKATFVGLIPDEEWEALVAKEVKAFVETETDLEFYHYKEPNRSFYGGHPEKSAHVKANGMTPLRAIVWQECASRLHEELKKQLLEYSFANHFDGDFSEEMKGVIEQLGSQIAANFFSTLIQNYGVQLRNEIRNM